MLDVPATLSLDEAAAQAGAGDCIAVAAGTHGSVELAGGVKLLGLALRKLVPTLIKLRARFAK